MRKIDKSLDKLNIYQLLENPFIYQLSQKILGPGGNEQIVGKIKELLSKIGNTSKVLDVGCGPASWLWQADLQPMGIDLSFEYIAAFKKKYSKCVNASSTALPFSDGAFNQVWSIFLFHHLPDTFVKQTVSEMTRVCASNGHVVIIDGVYPHSKVTRPIPFLIRYFDRGRYMRSEKKIRSLMPEKLFFSERFQYTNNGLEGMAFILQKK